MLIVYPNRTSRLWGDELRYSLRALDRYYVGEVDLLIIGDIPKWLTGAEVITTSHLDTTEQTNGRNVEMLCNMHSGDFIWFNDDIYLLDFCSVNTFKAGCVVQNLRDVKNRLYNRWGKLLWHTNDLLRHRSASTFNYESHSPYLFNARIMREVARQYPIFDGRALMATSYYNTHEPEKIRDCSVRLGIYKQGQPVMQRPCHKWLNHSDRGFSKNVVEFLQNKFPKKSRWER